MHEVPYTKFYNFIIEEHLPNLTEAELKTLIVIYRKTVGWGRARTKITRSYIILKTGLSAKSVSKAIQHLESKKLIHILDQHGKKYTTQDRKYANDLHFEIRIPPRVKLTHDRVKSSNSLEYNLHIIKERDKRKTHSQKPKIRKLTDEERILQILKGKHQQQTPRKPPVLPS